MRTMNRTTRTNGLGGDGASGDTSSRDASIVLIGHGEALPIFCWPLSSEQQLGITLGTVLVYVSMHRTGTG
ncbi:hypothetical protein [Pseudonocardia alni]|uniref:Uncharacterized protein n=2 Tax=Pseudonocardia alni TaxID=33907 RepID=A0A852WAD5_PSEA5|nr:hypothetical protein [Pseudonocardia antarctica]